jgi:two-component system cell cycle sensor histidine kinase/response regulator CckA
MKIVPPNAKGSVVGRIGDDALPELIPEYLGNETVLLAEDDPMLRKLLSRVLERYGYNVLVATDGASAIRLVSEYMAPIHLVLTDVVMPNRDGPSLTRDLRRWYPAMGVLLMSGRPEGESEAKLVKGDSTFFIGKPFTMEQLLAAVRAAIDWRPRTSRG